MLKGLREKVGLFLVFIVGKVRSFSSGFLFTQGFLAYCGETVCIFIDVSKWPKDWQVSVFRDPIRGRGVDTLNYFYYNVRKIH